MCLLTDVDASCFYTDRNMLCIYSSWSDFFSQWHMRVISGTQVAELGKIMVGDWPGQNVRKTPSQSVSQNMVACL
jgi:hypothetical protein